MNSIRNILLDAAKRGIRYRDEIADCHVAPSAQAVTAVAGFIEPMPDEGSTDAEILAMLDETSKPTDLSERRRSR